MHAAGQSGWIFRCRTDSAVARARLRALWSVWIVGVRISLGALGKPRKRGVFRCRQPYITPLNAPSHAGLPKALLVTCGFDMLRDVGHAYAKKLAAEGNDITYVRRPDLPHVGPGAVARRRPVGASRGVGYPR